MQTQLTFDAPALRDTGMQTALAGADWKTAALEVLKEFTGELQIEQLRARCEERGIVPPSPNAWGALAMTAVKLGIIVGTGRFECTKSAKTHSHRTQVYRRTS